MQKKNSEIPGESGLHRIIEKNADGIVILDRNGIVKFANPASEKLFGRNSEELIGEMLGFPFVSGETSEISVIHSSGRPIVAEMRVVDIDWENETAYLASMRDITDRKEAEETIKEERDRAEFYLDIINHDITNQNAAVISLLEFIIKSPAFSKEKGEDVHLALDLSWRISNTISNVKKLAYLNENSIELENIDPFDILSSAIQSVQSSNSDRRIEVSHSISASEICIRANNLLMDIFMNILTNAIKYNRNEKVKINIEHSLTEDKKFWRFEFKDNGSGISDPMKKRIFKRFQRGETNEYGTGLGLAIVNGIIRTYDGKVWVEDRVKGNYTQGSNFILLIPRGVLNN